MADLNKRIILYCDTCFGRNNLDNIIIRCHTCYDALTNWRKNVPANPEKNRTYILRTDNNIHIATLFSLEMQTMRNGYGDIIFFKDVIEYFPLPE